MTRAVRWSLVAFLVAACSKSDQSTKKWPEVGERWTDTSMMEVDWWRGLSWRVVATDSGPNVRAWMLRPDDEPDGSWTDLTFGVVALEAGGSARIGSWSTRGWVGRSEHRELSVGLGPSFQDPAWIWVSERHSCDDREDGTIAGNEYFFRIDGGRLAAVDELLTVDPSQHCVRSIDARFESEPPLRFLVEEDGRPHRYVFDEAEGFVVEPLR